MRARDICGLVVGAVLLASVAGAQTAAPTQSGLRWAVGDTWKVGTWYGEAVPPDLRAAQKAAYKFRGQRVVATFAVTSIKTVNDTNCYEVEVTLPREQTGFQRQYLLYVCEATGRMLQARDVSRRTDGTTKDITVDFSPSEGPTFVHDLPSIVPFDWPSFSQDVAGRKQDAYTKSQVTASKRVVLEDGTSQEQDEITMTEAAQQRQTKVVQRWRKGEPWWREARKYEDGQLVAEAVLLEVNGKTVMRSAEAAENRQ